MNLFSVDVRLARHAMRVALATWLAALISVSAWAGDDLDGVKALRKGDYSNSFSRLEPLARRGDPYAQFALAVMHDDGLGLPQDLGRALHWYHKAAEGGLVDAQYMVARFLGRGRGVTQDPAKAFFWFNIAAAGGHPYAARLRDQHAHQISAVQRRKMEAAAVDWHARHPAQFACDYRRCVYPSWTQSPRWRGFH